MRHIEIRDAIANALRAESYAGCMFEGFEVHSAPPHDGNIRLPAFVFIMDVPTVAFDMLGGERMMVFTLTIDMAFHYDDEGEMVNGQYYTGADLVNLYASNFTKLMRDVDLSNIPILDDEIMVTPRYPEEMDDDRYGFVAELRFTYKEAS